MPRFELIPSAPTKNFRNASSLSTVFDDKKNFIIRVVSKIYPGHVNLRSMEKSTNFIRFNTFGTTKLGLKEKITVALFLLLPLSAENSHDQTISVQ